MADRDASAALASGTRPPKRCACSRPRLGLIIGFWSSAPSPACLLRPEIDLIARSADREVLLQLPCGSTESPSNGRERFSFRCLEPARLTVSELLNVADILRDDLCSLAAGSFRLSLSKRHTIKNGHVGSSPRDRDWWVDYTQVFVAVDVRTERLGGAWHRRGRICRQRVEDAQRTLLRDLANEETCIIPLPSLPAIPITLASGQQAVASDGDLVIWEDLRDADPNTRRPYATYGYDLRTKTVFRLPFQAQVIDGDRAVGLQGTPLGDRISVFNIRTEEQVASWIVPGSARQLAIDSDIVVWVDKRGRGTEIFGYDLAKGSEFLVTSEASDTPAIDGNLVVWQRMGDYGGGEDANIYATYLPND